MTPKVAVPARLWGYLARNAPVGVILRRGPKEWVQMIHWDTKNDIFTPGHWMKGRIAEQRSALSPDGKLFIYAVSLPSNKIYNPDYTPNPDYGTGWTAVSKPPYFTALALWPHTMGGGFFVDDRTVYVTTWQYHPDHEPKGLKVVPNAVNVSWFELNGWIKLIDPDRDWIIQNNRGYIAVSLVEEWQKDVDDFGFSLIVKNRSGYKAPKGKRPAGKRLGDNLEYGLINRINNQSSTLNDIVWADFDQQKRLVLAKAGKLFSATVADGELSLTELADFNANKPEAIESPDWAKHW